MERWKMHRMGFVNFWVYDVQEFILNDGKILLRGANASGKSITTQSFIPYILDGDRQPTRLDPFGGKDRKMDFYLIGSPENGKEESTCYLYLEFIKPESRQYRTIGIGLHAKKGAKMKTWHFGLLDGRRIGYDFMLYEEKGDQLIPHDAARLKKQLGESNFYTEKTTEYEAFVAEKIFGFEKTCLDDFRQLTNILIKTRSSKLSAKENLKPAQLYAILNESLCPLSDDDLRPMAEAMSKIEDTHERIAKANEALSEARHLAAEYERYNRYMLWKKADLYLKKSVEVNKTKRLLEARNDDILAAEKDYQEADRLLDEALHRLEVLNEEKNGLNISGIEEQLQRKKEKAENLARDKKTEAEKKKIMEDKQHKVKAKYRECSEIKIKISDCEYEIKKVISDLQAYEEYCFPFYDAYYRKIRSGEQLQTAECRHECRSFSNRLKQVLQLLKEQERQRAEYESSEQQLSEKQEAVYRCRKSLETAQNMYTEQKDSFIEQMFMARKNNKEFCIDAGLLERLESLVVNYEGEGSGRDLNDMLSSRRLQLSEMLQEVILSAKQEMNSRDDACKALQEQLKELQKTDEPVPERSDDRIAAREILTKNNISFRSFYECIDFKESVPETQRAVLEAELSDMGLLDALVIAKKDREKAAALLGELADSYLVSNKSLTGIVNSFFEVTNQELVEEIQCILSQFETQVQLGTDGCYQHGIMAGHSLGQAHVLYIGAENRRLFRERQIAQLTVEIAEAEKLLLSAQADYQSALERKEQLEQEYSAFPDTKDLNQALNLVNTEYANLSQSERVCADAQEKRDQEFHKLNALVEQIEKSSCVFPMYEKTVSYYEEVAGAVEDCLSLVENAADHLYKKQEQERHLVNAKEQAENYEADVDTLDQELKNLRNTIDICEEVIRQCDEFLNRPENVDIALRQQELERKIKDLNQQIEDCRIRMAKSEQTAQILKAGISEIENDLIALIQQENQLANYFEEEWELKYIFDDETLTLNQKAKQAQKCAYDGDEQKNIQEISTRLEEVYRKRSNALSGEYRPMKELLFPNAEPDSIRTRTRITLTWYGHQLPPAVFADDLAAAIENDKLLIKKEEEEMFRTILMNTISKKLYLRIDTSRKWVKSMSELMQGINTSMGLSFSLSWKPKRDIGEHELSFEELNKLLAGDAQLMRAEDYERLSAHFRSRIEHERLVMEEKGQDVNYTELVRNVLDFRNWFEFSLHYRYSGKPLQEMTVSRFNTFSGGERALSLYIPLFAAVAAQYQKAGNQAPRILALDEAFAGVDDSNISEMFALLEKLEFGYILNSQALWGCYDSVPSLAIAELCHEKDSDFITVISYEWNGSHKLLKEEQAVGI